MRHYSENEGTDEIAVSQVDPSSPPEAAELALLEILAWGKEPTPEQIASRAARIGRELQTLDPAKKIFFLAHRAGVLVGAVRLWRDSDDQTVWWLVGLVVHPQYRRRGIATRLTQACLAYAKDWQGNLLRSEVHLDNEVSIRFHEGFGFVNDGRFVAPDGDQKVAFSLPIR